MYVYLSYSSSVHLEFSAAQVVLWRHNWHLKTNLSKYLSLYSLFLFNRSNFLYFYSSYKAVVHLEFLLSQVVLWRHNWDLKMNLSKYLSLYSLFFVQSIYFFVFLLFIPSYCAFRIFSVTSCFMTSQSTLKDEFKQILIPILIIFVQSI